MVDLPSVPRRLVTSEMPQSRVSPADVAAPYRALADALGAGGEALLNYQKAAAAGAYARLSNDARNAAQKLAIQANGNAEFFEKEWQTYSKQTMKNVPLSLRRRFEDDLFTFGGNQYREIIGQRYEQDTNSAKAALETELGLVENDLLSMAYRGEAATEGYVAAQAKYRSLYDELTGNPAFGVSPEGAEFAITRLEASLVRESVRHKVETLFSNDPAAARRYAEQALNDPDLPLSAAERRTAIADAMSWHDKLSAETRVERTAWREEVRDLERTLIDTDAYVAAEDIAAAIARGHELHDPAYVRRIEDAARLRELRTGFNAIPAGRDKLDVYDAAIGGTGKGVLDLIAQAEGTDKGRGYNETLGYGAFTGGPRDLTTMTLDEIDAMQTEMLRDPDNHFNSSAAGRYQIVQKTLRGLREQFGLTGSELYDEAMQDRLAMALLERRGGSVEGLRNEWEGLRRVDAQTIAAAARGVGSYDPAIVKAYRTELSDDLDGLIGDAKDVIGRGWGLDTDTASLLVDYARAVNDPDKIRSVVEILDESALHEGVNGMSNAERMVFRNQLLDPNGAGDDAVRARMLAAEERNARHRKEMLEASPLRYGVERGWYEGDKPLDFANPEAMSANLTGRMQKLQIVAEHEGPVTQSALYPEEIETMARWWGGASPEDRVVMASTFAQSLDQETLQATLGSFADKPEMQPLIAAGTLFPANPEAATGIIRGQALLAANANLAPKGETGAADWASAASEAMPIGSLAPPLEVARQRMFDAAKLRYADLSYRAGDESGEFNQGRFDQALSEVTGGMVELNGRAVPAPNYGMTQGNFNAMIRDLPDTMLSGAVAGDGSPISAADIRSQGKLSMLDQGKYAVEIGGGWVLGQDGLPFVLDLAQTVNREAKADRIPAPAGYVEQATATYRQKLIDQGVTGGELEERTNFYRERLQGYVAE